MYPLLVFSFLRRHYVSPLVIIIHSFSFFFFVAFCGYISGSCSQIDTSISYKAQGNVWCCTLVVFVAILVHLITVFSCHHSATICATLPLRVHEPLRSYRTYSADASFVVLIQPACNILLCSHSPRSRRAHSAFSILLCRSQALSLTQPSFALVGSLPASQPPRSTFDPVLTPRCSTLILNVPSFALVRPKPVSQFPRSRRAFSSRDLTCFRFLPLLLVTAWWHYSL